MAAAQIDLIGVLPSIKAPTLIVGGENSPMERAVKVREWQQLIPNSELLVMPGTLCHAAARPDEAAGYVLAFMQRRSAG